MLRGRVELRERCDCGRGRRGAEPLEPPSCVDFAVGFFLLGEVGFGRLERGLGLFERHFGALRVERRQQLPWVTCWPC